MQQINEIHGKRRSGRTTKLVDAYLKSNTNHSLLVLQHSVPETLVGNVLYTDKTSKIQFELDKNKYSEVFIDGYEYLVGKQLKFPDNTKITRVRGILKF
jgi:hypothetical protein